MNPKRLSNFLSLVVTIGLTALIDLGCAQADGPSEPSNDRHVHSGKLESMGEMRPSFYWVAIEKNDGAPRTKKLFDHNGNLLYAVSPAYYKQLAMEGTGKLLNGKIINYHSRKTNPDGSREILWQFCPPEAPYGYGLGPVPLIPFRSVATDLSVIPLGSKVFIPAAIGAVLPDGTVHDGYFTAVDIGDMIKNKKIDIFTAYGDQSHVFTRIGLQTGKMTEVFVVR